MIELIADRAAAVLCLLSYFDLQKVGKESSLPKRIGIKG